MDRYGFSVLPVELAVPVFLHFFLISCFLREPDRTRHRFLVEPTRSSPVFKAMIKTQIDLRNAHLFFVLFFFFFYQKCL